jgi:molybdenum-dependent DNA-binding transcriptional regulator ModE
LTFIAQELEKIYPEMVFTDDKGYKSVDYSRLTPVLVEAIKELNAKNEDQKKLIQALQNESVNTAEKMLKLEAAVEFLMKSNIKEEAKK